MACHLCEFVSCVRKCSRKYHLRYFITSNVLQKVIDVPIAPGGTSLQTIRHPSHLGNVEINRRIIFTHSVSHCLVLEGPKGRQYLMQTADPAICYCPANYSVPSQITIFRIRKLSITERLAQDKTLMPRTGSTEPWVQNVIKMKKASSRYQKQTVFREVSPRSLISNLLH